MLDTVAWWTPRAATGGQGSRTRSSSPRAREPAEVKKLGRLTSHVYE